MLKTSFLCALFLSLFIAQGHAETKYVSTPVPPLFFHDLTQSPVSVKVMKVIDPLTFMGEDKNLYALSGIDIPAEATAKADITLEASKTLALLIEGKELKLYVTKNREKGRINRMNQPVVQAELKQDSIWVEGELLAAGLARVRTTPSNPEMVEQMLKLEQSAREAKRGLWADSRLQVLAPDTSAGHDNTFQIVEGAPKAAAITQNMIFLNFGDDYRQDFTVGIPSNLRMAFARKGIDPLKLAHVKLRIRGWMQSYNGPFIEIDHPEQIEILERIPLFTKAEDTSDEPPPGSDNNSFGMRTIGAPKPPVVAEPVKPQVEEPAKKKQRDPNP